MKIINTILAPGKTVPPFFKAARAFAFSLAKSDNELLESELVAWVDRSTGMPSTVLESCSGPDGWRYYGISHGGRLEVDVDGVTSFIFGESSPLTPTRILGSALTAICEMPKGASLSANQMAVIASLLTNEPAS